MRRIDLPDVDKTVVTCNVKGNIVTLHLNQMQHQEWTTVCLLKGELEDLIEFLQEAKEEMR